MQLPNVIAKARENLGSDPHIKGLKLNVYFKDGHLVVEGRSRNFHQKQIATHAVINLGLPVINKIEVD